MIDFFKLDPIHTNTPRGRILKYIPKKIEKSPAKCNPQISFVVKSKNSFSNGKVLDNSFLQESFDFSQSNPTKQFAKTSRSSLEKEKRTFRNHSTTLNADKSPGIKIKSFSQALMRKKLKSVCYTRRQMTKMQLNKCIQNLYLKVQSQKISMETPKIHVKQRQTRPYMKQPQATQPLFYS